MKIGNVRLGLATNSSSTHYIVFLDKDSKNRYLDDDCGDQQYGWNEFTCAQTGSKLEYLSHILYRSVVGNVGEIYAKTIVDAWIGDGLYNENGYIDHNSSAHLPYSYDSSKTIDKDFFKDFKDYLSKDNVLIIGGNDNSSPNHPAHYDKNASVSRVDSLDSGNLVCRKDGSVWYLFNRNSGARFSLSFDDAVEDFRPQAPLLVDLKITDYCLSGCNFCYQNSTPQGLHAKISDIEIIIKALERLKVFEVAIGGGEPTEHPEFQKLMSYSSYEEPKIVKNFASRNPQSVRDFLTPLKKLMQIPDCELSPFAIYKKNKSQDVLQEYGACALTIGSSSDVKKFMATCSHKIKKSKLIFHYVMGTTGEKEFKDILQACKIFEIPIILLGFKNFGRGAEFEPKNYDNWVQIVKEVGGEVGIDTALASSYEDDLKDEQVSELTYSTSETDTSMYIDAVQLTMRPSSYSDPKEMIRLSIPSNTWSDDAAKNVADQIQNAFLNFRTDSQTNKKLKPRTLNEMSFSKIIRGNRPWWHYSYEE